MVKNEITQILSERLEALTESKRDVDYELSNKKQAEQIDIPYPTFNNYKYNKAECPISTIVKIAKYYNVSTDYLLGLSEVKSNNADLISVCQYTGLNEEAVSMLRQFNTKEHKDLMGVVNRLISEGDLTDMARILSAKEQVKYLKYDFMDFMVNLANKFVRR